MRWPLPFGRAWDALDRVTALRHRLQGAASIGAATMKPGALAIVGALATVSCGLDLGAGGGVVNTPGAVGFGRLAASTKINIPMNEYGPLVGLAVESRAEEDVGVRYLGGIMVGYGESPQQWGKPYGFEAYGEIGTPFRSTLLHHGD